MACESLEPDSVDATLDLKAPQKARKLAPGHLETIFLAMAILMIVFGGTLYVVGNRVIASNIHQKAMRAQIERIEDVFSAIWKAEADQRGFLLTQDDRYLQQFNNGAKLFSKNLAEAKQDWRKNPAPVSRIIKLAEQKMAELRVAIELRQRGRVAEADQTERTSLGNGLMTQLRAELEDLVAVEERNLDQEMKEQDRLTELRSDLFLVTAAVNIVFLGWAYGRISRALEENEAATSLRYET